MLNKPFEINKGTDNIAYVYSAQGEKLAKKMKDNSYQYYAGNMVYKNDRSLNYLLMDEGMVNKVSGGYAYEYHLKDHLGNTRVAFQPNGSSTTVTQATEYYPFGMNYMPHSPAGSNKYLYNGKEKQDDQLSGTFLDWYDFHARYYDSVLGRTTMMDPMAEKFYGMSPYSMFANNPVRFIDPTGMEFTESAWEWVTKLLTEITSKNSALASDIEEKSAIISSGVGKNGEALTNKQISKLEKQIGNKLAQISNNSSVVSEIIELSASDQIYDVRTDNSLSVSGPIQGTGEDRAGAVFNFSNENFDILLPSSANIGFFAHELKHAYQFETGAFSTGPKGIPFYDQSDEREAIARGALLGSTQTWSPLYDNLPKGPIDATNHPNIMHTLSNPAVLQNISTNTRSAFRINGKTYKPLR